VSETSRDAIVGWALGAALLAQGAMLVYLGELPLRTALQCLLVAAALGVATAYAWRERLRMNHRVDMAIVMAAFGGLGMAVGWWVDFGLGRAPLWMRLGVAAPGPWSFWGKVFSFMTLGMLVAAIPPSLALTRCARLARESRRRWVATHILGNVTMVAGMIVVNRWLGRAIGRLAGSLVVGAHVAMMLGMILGMVAGMWLGEALLGLRPWRELARASEQGD
jgi:hypothetical protein